MNLVEKMFKWFFPPTDSLPIPTAPADAMALVGMRVVDTNHFPQEEGIVIKVAPLQEIDPEHPGVRYLGGYPLVVVRYEGGKERRYFFHLASFVWCRKGSKAWILIGPWFTFSPQLFPEKCDAMHSLELEIQPA